MDSIKSKKTVKAGTGTDFDQRRSMQIPQESIMAGAKKDLDEEKEDSSDAPMIKGNIVFDEE